MVSMNRSNNSTSADNQQERLAWWIVGFVDGEGTFSVSINRNPTTRTGFQVFPEFVVTQGAKSLHCLQLIKDYFGCGKIYENRRHDNHNESVYKYVVRANSDLTRKIIPFFERYNLKTAKMSDFSLFCCIINLMKQGKHLEVDGIDSIKEFVNKMNRRAKILRH